MDEEATATEKTTTLDGVTIEYIDASAAGVEDETNLNVDVCRDDADDCVKGDVGEGVADLFAFILRLPVLPFRLVLAFK
uniref:Uncharacterized protein n=1 Tax=Glossina palpalis gambiensis TaxID=67801 RepID=A0A1B0C793_9MUSC